MKAIIRPAIVQLRVEGFVFRKLRFWPLNARVLGVPARVGYADVKNHLTTENFDALVGSNIYRWHSYALNYYIDGLWVKATPAFNKSLCGAFRGTYFRV